MGRSLTPEEHVAVLEWANQHTSSRVATDFPISPSGIKNVYDYELKQYFRLCALARSKSADTRLAAEAHENLFGTRVRIEKAISYSIANHSTEWNARLAALTSRSIYGASKKQGVSIRLPLSTCNPTTLCAGGCYAHDVLDAAPNSVVRGAINGWIAREFEQGNNTQRSHILNKLLPHTRRAVKAARDELARLPSGYTRRPNIRFSHVGEIVFYPQFANALAAQVKQTSSDGVDCVVYTRHRRVNELDEALWVINFTLDPVSEDRKGWIPTYARTVFSAFGGQVSPLADINFLEHHRHFHTDQVLGDGRVCPATAPSTVERTCDACACNRCFVRPSEIPQQTNMDG